jgi:hypothetical protein
MEFILKHKEFLYIASGIITIISGIKYKSIYKIIKATCKWFKIIFTINNLNERIVKLESKPEAKNEGNGAIEIRNKFKSLLNNIDNARYAVLYQFYSAKKDSMWFEIGDTRVLSLEKDGFVEKLAKGGTQAPFRLNDSIKDLLYEYCEKRPLNE